MIVKRLIGVVTVRNGWAVQSFGYRRWLPLGRPEILVANLDRWGVDEILVQCIDRSAAGAGPDLALLERIAATGCATPLIYAGGIRDVDDAAAVVRCAADRVAIDALLHDAPERLPALADRLGAQAVIAALPLSTAGWRDYRSGTDGPLPVSVRNLLADGHVSEVLVIDWRNEGTPGGFDTALLDPDLPDGLRLIAFGGLTEPSVMRLALANPRVAAIAVGNALSYREHAVQAAKEALGGAPLRAAHYA